MVLVRKKESPLEMQLTKSYPNGQQLIELLHKTQSTNESHKTFRVKYIVSKVLSNRDTSPHKPFKEGTIVKQARGNNYGVVEKIEEGGSEQIKIAWWKKGEEDIPWWHKRFRGRKNQFVDEKISYPLEYLKPIGVETITELIPGKTFLKIEKGASIILEDDQMVQLGDKDIFFLSKKENEQYHLIRPGEEWILPAEPLSKIACPIGYLIEEPTRAQLQAAKQRSRRELVLSAKIFLGQAETEQLLEKIKEGKDPKEKLQSAFKKKIESETDSTEDLEETWEEAYKWLIESKKEGEGIWNYRIGDRVIQWKEYKAYINGKEEIKYSYSEGKIKDIDIIPDNPGLIIKWESGEESAHDKKELEKSHISKIQLIHLSRDISYEVSEDEKYYKALIGFRTKKLAKSWLKKLKKELGWISDPKASSTEWNPTNSKYYCISSRPKQKTIKGRVKRLIRVSEWDLSQPSKK
jgi:hypothetical protein